LRKTKLCSLSNLPLDRCNVLIKLLIDRGLVFERVIEGKRYYEISDRGYEYIALYNKLNEIIDLKSHFVSNY